MKHYFDGKENNNNEKLERLDELRVNLLLNSLLKAQTAADLLLENNVAEGNKMALAFKKSLRQIAKIF